MASKKAPKVQKNVELVSILASHIESEMDYGDKIRITPLAKSLILHNKSHPHVDTVRSKLTEAEIWKTVAKHLKFHYKDNKLYEIEKVEPEKDDVFFKKEVRQQLTNIQNRQDQLDTQYEDLIKEIKDLKEELKKLLQKEK